MLLCGDNKNKINQTKKQVSLNQTKKHQPSQTITPTDMTEVTKLQTSTSFFNIFYYMAPLGPVMEDTCTFS